MARGSRRKGLARSAAMATAPDTTPRIRLPAPGTAGEPIDPETVKFVEAPEFYGSGCQVTLLGNDFVFMFLRPRVALIPQTDGAPIAAGTMLPTLYLTLSVPAAKDLSVVLAEVLGQYEKDMGEVDTPFTRIKAAAAKEK